MGGDDGKTVEEAQELALDQLGTWSPTKPSSRSSTTPKPGLFGRVRGEARVRARVRPAPVRPKQDRRAARARRRVAAPRTTADGRGRRLRRSQAAARRRGAAATPHRAAGRRRAERDAATPTADRQPRRKRHEPDERSHDHRWCVRPTDAVDVDAVREAAVEFVGGLIEAFGFEATVDAGVEGSEIEVRVEGTSLGLLIGPGGRTLLAVQDLARVAAQRRLGDHDTRLRVDVAGYREKRREALERFAATVAEQVKSSGVARSLDPMPSADRKVLHDALAAIDGVRAAPRARIPTAASSSPPAERRRWRTTRRRRRWSRRSVRRSAWACSVPGRS